jgi:hypothetical protein
MVANPTWQLGNWQPPVSESRAAKPNLVLLHALFIAG